VAIGGARVVGSNQIAITYVNLTSAAVTPAAEAYTVVGLNTMPPVNHITSYGAVATGLSSVASQTSSEQGITVNGLLATDICVGVQKPTLSTGLLNGTGRISAANTLQITYENVTAAAITPVAEVYTIGVFNAVGPLTGVPGSWVALGARTGCGQTINLTNELQQALGEAGVGIIRGA